MRKYWTRQFRALDNLIGDQVKFCTVYVGAGLTRPDAITAMNGVMHHIPLFDFIMPNDPQYKWFTWFTTSIGVINKCMCNSSTGRESHRITFGNGLYISIEPDKAIACDNVN